MEKMPEIFNFFECILNVDIPIFVSKIINRELDENFRPSFLYDNPDEDIFYRAIFFNIDDLYIIIQNMLKFK